MAEREHLDTFADQMALQVGAYGCALTFALARAGVDPKEGPVEVIPVATIRLSLEHVMAYIFRGVVMDFEKKAEGAVPVLPETLAKMGISREAWGKFWEAD